MQKKIVKLPKPLTYQKDIIDWVNDPTIKFITFLKSRQSGGSFLNKLLVAKWSLENNNEKIAYITPTLKLSKLFFKELCQSLQPYIRNENRTDLIIEFITGTYVQFFSAESKDSIRGFQFHYVIMDEVAFMNTDDINLIIRPTWMIIGKKIIFTSTPNGNQGFFFDNYNLALNDEPGHKLKQISIYDNPFISPEDIEAIRKQVPERVFKQEYLGEFVNGSGTVFSNYMNCIGEPIIKQDIYYAGIDWGKVNDYTVLTIINSHKEVVDIYRINGLDYTQQVQIIADRLNKWKPKKVISEENNIGTVVNELLKKLYKGNIQTVTLDNSMKKDIIENLIVGFETQDITIPNNDILLRELQSFSCKYNHNTQTIKYTAPNGLHDDTIISLAYAYSLVKNNKKNVQIRIL
jgi:phage FluMu gp28-like protein